MVNDNIEQFYHDDMGDNLLKACPEYGCYGTGFVNIMGSNSLVRLHVEHGYKNVFGHYCNAGVVLFDLAKMREEGLSAQQFMDYCQKLTKPLRMNDQDFLNLFFEGRIKLANPYRYNCLMTPLAYMIRCFFNDFSGVDMSEAPYPRPAGQTAPPQWRGTKFDPQQILVYHYNSRVKPNELSYHHKYAHIFWRYQLLDPADSSRHTWMRLWQTVWGPIRRLVPEVPLAFKRKKPEDYLKNNRDSN